LKALGFRGHGRAERNKSPKFGLCDVVRTLALGFRTAWVIFDRFNVVLRCPAILRKRTSGPLVFMSTRPSTPPPVRYFGRSTASSTWRSQPQPRRRARSDSDRNWAGSPRRDCASGSTTCLRRKSRPLREPQRRYNERWECVKERAFMSRAANASLRSESDRKPLQD
jgi:hypothetical protein